ncbi:MAG: hypothetical protein ACRD45_23480 [Bryobacteraceae bacterium]
MTLDQKIQIWVAIGEWIAGIGTIAATVVALYLAKRAEKLRLKVRVELMQVVMSDGTLFQDHLGIDVTNAGERPVTIDTIGWAVGKGKKRKYAVQPLHSPHSQQCPIELSYGKAAKFSCFVRCCTELGARVRGRLCPRPLREKSKTLVVQVQTALGFVEAHPMSNPIELIKTASQKG